jgi:hypothetical protein
MYIFGGTDVKLVPPINPCLFYYLRYLLNSNET